MTDDGDFTWMPTADQEGAFEIIVIAVDAGDPRLGDAETFTVVVGDLDNEAPVVDLNGDLVGTGFTAAFSEDQGPVSIISDEATITDTDSNELTLATVVITNRQNGAVETLSADTSGISIVQEFDAAAGLLTLSGVDTVENYQQVLRTVTYNNTSQIQGQ